MGDLRLPANRANRFTFHSTHKGTDGVAWCELCGVRPATDFHHILSRAHVPKFLQPDIPVELCAYLCNPCNVEIGDTYDARLALLTANCKRYGYAQVRGAWDEFKAKAKTPPMFIEVILDQIKENENA